MDFYAVREGAWASRLELWTCGAMGVIYPAGLQFFTRRIQVRW
jgi:hypothetical protein